MIQDVDEGLLLSAEKRLYESARRLAKLVRGEPAKLSPGNACWRCRGIDVPGRNRLAQGQSGEFCLVKAREKMLTAIDDRSRRLVPADLSRASSFHCPECLDAVALKVGTGRGITSRRILLMVETGSPVAPFVPGRTRSRVRSAEQAKESSPQQRSRARSGTRSSSRRHMTVLALSVAPTCRLVAKCRTVGSGRNSTLIDQRRREVPTGLGPSPSGCNGNHLAVGEAHQGRRQRPRPTCGSDLGRVEADTCGSAPVRAPPRRHS